MAAKSETALAPASRARDPFSLLRQMTSELDRVFDEPGWPFRAPFFRQGALAETAAWMPVIDVSEKDNRLITRVDLPGMKKDDVKVEVSDGQLVISGERKREVEEKKERFYRSEREYGSFLRSVPLPEGVKLEDVTATFADGVLEVSVPLPAKPETRAKKVEIQESGKGAATAAQGR
jgi:HSP20 family protein